MLPMEGGRRYPYGGNQGNHYGVIRKGTHIRDVVRVYGEPDYTDSFMRGRNRIDVLYYYQPIWNQRYNTRERAVVKYTFRNSYLQSVKQDKVKYRKNKDRYERRRDWDNRNRRKYRRYY